MRGRSATRSRSRPRRRATACARRSRAAWPRSRRGGKVARWTSPRPDDPRLAVLRELPRGAGARTDRVIVEGELAVLRALASRHEVELVVAGAAAAARLDEALP